MSRATKIISRVNQVLASLNVTNRVVYKRVISRTGGDPLLGRPGAVDIADTVLSPQPAVEYVPTIVNNRGLNKNHPLVVGGQIAMVGDYLLTMSATSITKDDLENPDTVFALKTTTSEEERAVVSYDPAVINGIDVAYFVLVRSVERTSSV